MKPRYFPPDAVLFPEADAVPIPKRVCDTSTWGIVREDTEPELDLAAGSDWQPDNAAIWGAWCAYVQQPAACHVDEREAVTEYIAKLTVHLQRVRAAILSMEIETVEVAA